MAARLTSLLRAQGVSVDHWVAQGGRSSGGALRRIGGGNLGHYLWRATSFLSRKSGYPDIYTFEWWSPSIRELQGKYDVIHIHDTSRALSPYTVKALAQARPTVWTLHDCSAFTAGCIFPMGCDNFTRSCGNCPQLDEWPLETAIDKTERIYGIKQAIFSKLGIDLVAPSNWMAGELARSSIFKAQAKVIPNGVDTSLYRPVEDMHVVRSGLGLPEDKFLVLLSAARLDDPRKGVKSALQVLKSFAGPFHLVLIGQPSTSVLGELQGLDYTVAGYIDSPEKLRDWYGAADVMLFTSAADNLPTAILESMACGTPCVAFATGGVPEMIEHDVSGWLVGEGDLAGACAGLEAVRSDSNRLARWSRAGRQRMLDHFSEEEFVRRHLELYHQVLERVDAKGTCP